jgi:hypothetical protein
MMTPPAPRLRNNLCGQDHKHFMEPAMAVDPNYNPSALSDLAFDLGTSISKPSAEAIAAYHTMLAEHQAAQLARLEAAQAKRARRQARNLVNSKCTGAARCRGNVA